jgi:predicted metal-dependent phosphoesterase TrpH/glycosyltransferase involved in cell wall biosynthesis
LFPVNQPPSLEYPAPVPGAGELSILQVSPHVWEESHDVNGFVERSAAELVERGHRVAIAAPSGSRAAIRESRAAIREARDRPASLFRRGTPRVLALGAGVPLPRGPRPRAAPVPLDGSRPLEGLLESVPFDVVHVHEPYAPSFSSAALRHSWSLNVATFHEPEERLLSTQVARPLVEIFFGRLDARTATARTTAELLERFFPGSYELLTPGTVEIPRRRSRGGPLRILYCAEEERGALRLFLRALRRLPEELDWRATVWTPDGREPVVRIAKRLRARIEWAGPADGSPPELMARSDILCAASGGPAPAPSVVRQAFASGAVPVVSQLPLYGELVQEGELGLLFPPGDADTLAGQIARVGQNPEMLGAFRHRARSEAPLRSWSEVADQLEELYGRLAARRQDADGNREVRRRVARRGLVEVDLHMHTDHSPDCATPVEVLLETARDRGLGAIAITDHNEVSGALAAREIAAGMDDLKIIVAEEVKTAEQGEVIGLFVEERIERGMTMAETIAEIRRQGGLVYVPHPFDRLHSVPDYEHLLDMVEEIDILEVFALTLFNEEAERFAQKYRIVPGAGSDSHVAQGLGSVRIRMHDFDGPEEFLESMRDADITRKHRNLVYVQALKFLQTTGRPKAAKRSVGGAKPVRGGRPRRRPAGRRGAGKS